MKQTVISIAGAHRSGTSMLTRLLHAGGLALGQEQDMMPAAADNPDGFWENLRFVHLNDEILNAVGAAWDLPPALEESFSGPRFEPIQAKAELLISSFSDRPVWGWKDPRNCLTLPFWRRLVPDLKVVSIVRNPLEVAYSMHKRNGTSYALGLRLWEIYNRRLFANAESSKRIVADYQAFFHRPETELERILNFTELPAEQAAAAAAIVTKDRRHTAFTTEQLIDAGISGEIVSFYSNLIKEAGQSQPRIEDVEIPNNLARSALSDRSLSSQQDNLAGSASQLNLAIPETETVRRELAWRRGHEIEQKEKIEQLRARIENLTQEMAGKSERLALELGRRDGRITELQNAYQHLDDLLLREQCSRERIYQELQQLRDRFAQTNRLLHSHSIQLADSEATTGTLTQRLRTELRETKRLIRLLDEVQDVGERLRQSRRWILVNPFAWVMSKFTGKKLRGFGHLDRIAEKYRTWRTAHPEIEQLDSTIAALKSPRSHSLEGDLATAASEKMVAFKPAPSTKPIAFPRSEEVEVSIIIPVFNQINYTKACLASVQDRSEGIPYEVIVVDDCSTDSTAGELQAIPGLGYLPNESNGGFIASCNAGAKKARGRYLVFLNNDTVVTSRWLTRLRETFDLVPKAGLVGSKLVYPDGRLQEAGGIIWRDASGWNRGKFQDADKPEYNFLREVDYCSAASVMIPKALFESLGGFDSAYAPAYYEDTDLAFKVAKSGRKVLYQPLSVVTHYEGISGGTDIAAGTKKYQEVNRETFARTWANELATKPANGDLAAWDELPDDCQRILVIDHHVPLVDRDSGSLRMFQILTLLRQIGHRITFLPDNLADIPPYGDNLRKHGIEVVHLPYIKSIREYLESAGEQFDAVVLSRRDFASKHIANVRLHAPQARLIFDTVDLHFLREEREADLTDNAELRRETETKRQLEYDLIDEADETWVVSPVEKEFLQRERPETSIEVVSNIVPIPGSVTSFAARRDILFIGSFKHTPNIDAVVFFTREIFPSVRNRLGDVKFYVIGEKAPPEVIGLMDESVIVTGFQPDVSCYFNSIRLSVAPLRYGAGVKGKINQSMAFGVPVVATSIAAEGMALRDGKDVRIADRQNDFADAVVEVYQSEELWQKISANSLEMASTVYSPVAAQRNLARIFSNSQKVPFQGARGDGLSDSSGLAVASKSSQVGI